jgi:hypothetical protein
MKRLNKMRGLSLNKKRDKSLKKAQEEIAGFAIILVLLGIILLAFLAASLKKPEKDTLENYEAGNFLQSVLQQTTRCKINEEYKDIQDLIFECDKRSICENTNTLSCIVLENTLREIVKESWRLEGEDPPYTGYDLAILLNGENLIDTIVEGETSGNNYGSGQDFSKPGEEIVIYFTLYYKN